MATKIVLRYFRALGRAQPLRHALLDAEVPFDDVQMDVSEWPACKADPAFAGPYEGLPTLSWDAAIVVETLPIASFLARRLGHYERLDDVGIARLEAVCSNCYLEVMLRLGEMIYADLLYPQADLAQSCPLLFTHMAGKMRCLEATTPESGWIGGRAPSLADFFAAEAVEAMGYALGPAGEAAMQSRLPRLTSLAKRVAARPPISQAWDKRPATFSARADEPRVIEGLRARNLTKILSG